MPKPQRQPTALESSLGQLLDNRPLIVGGDDRAYAEIHASHNTPGRRAKLLELTAAGTSFLIALDKCKDIE